MATIGDVAKRAGVSTTLVSRYLNGVKGVSPASKEKIESAIRDLNYVPDESARMLVRRRGGGAALEAAKPVSVQSNAIALICEDTDAQLLMALYLGAKIALRSQDATEGMHLMLFCIPPGDTRGEDEQETLAFASAVCRGVYAVGVRTELRAALEALPLPVLSLRAADNARTLYRAASDYRETLTSVEQESGARIVRLCEKITAEDRSVTEELLDVHLTVSDDSQPDRSPLGRSLQSHLL